MNLRKILLTSVFAILAALPGSSLHAAEPGASVYLPNMHGKSLTTPVAWGASNNVVFVGIGGNYPSPYTSDADGAAVAGFGVGDPVKNLASRLLWSPLTSPSGKSTQCHFISLATSQKQPQSE